MLALPTWSLRQVRVSEAAEGDLLAYSAKLLLRAGRSKRLMLAMLPASRQSARSRLCGQRSECGGRSQFAGTWLTVMLPPCPRRQRAAVTARVQRGAAEHRYTSPQAPLSSR